MKLTTLLMVLFISGVFATNVTSQVSKVTIMLSDVTVAQVINAVEEQTNYLFVYDKREIDLQRKITLTADNKTVAEVLSTLFHNTNVVYAMEGNNIMLMAIKDPIQPQRRINGIVTNMVGQPLEGVTIMVKGTSKGTVTNAEGKYLITDIANDATLVFSFVGMLTREEVVGTQTNMNVAMMQDIIGIEEVVAVGYGTLKKGDLTGAITQVKASELNLFFPSNVSDLMRTSIAGLQVGYSTSAKGNSSFLIRGSTTLTASSSPLIVIDGVIFTGDISDINPDDIDRLDVLKDASSAAVYGSRATNGVIAITTKRGESEKSSVTFNTNIGIATSANRVRTYNGEEYIAWRTQMFKSINKETGNESWSPFDDPRTINPNYLNEWINFHSTSEQYMIDAWLGALNLTNIEIENYKAGKTIDWEDIIFQNGMRQDYNLSLSGKKTNLNYYWSLGYMKNEALVAGDEFSTIRSRLNFEGQPTRFLKLGLNGHFSYRDESSVPALDGMYRGLSPFGSYFEKDGETIKIRPHEVTLVLHPLHERIYKNREREYFTFFPKLYFILELPFGITFTSNYTTRFEFYHQYEHNSSEHPEWQAFGGEASRNNSLTREWQIDNILNWNYAFSKLHKVDLTLLSNAEKKRYNSDGLSNRYFSPNDILGYHNMTTGLDPRLSSNDLLETADALMARINYGFSNKYLLTFSVRRDGSSLFGYQNPRATFPAAALGWVITEENFFNVKAVNFLKIRTSWGRNGNRDIANYAALSKIGTGKYLNADQTGNAYTVPTLVVNTMENRSLSWEKTEAFNFGIDFNIFEGNLSGSLDGYTTITTDALVNRELPSITGFDRVYANLGKVKNKGIEFSLNTLILKRNNIVWKSKFNFALNRNKIVSITGEKVDIYDDEGRVVGRREPDDIDNNWFIGQAKDVVWDFKILGTWKTGEELEAAKWNQSPGDYRLEDLNGDGFLTNEDKQFLGYIEPRFTWNLSNNINLYKNIELSFVLYSLWGHKSTYWVMWGSPNPFRLPILNESKLTEENMWVVPYWTSDNQVDNYSRLSATGPQGVAFNDWRERSYIRLENVAIAYRMPENYLNRVLINDLKIVFNIRNAALWAPEWNFGDPEHRSGAQRIFSLGLNFTI